MSSPSTAISSLFLMKDNISFRRGTAKCFVGKGEVFVKLFQNIDFFRLIESDVFFEEAEVAVNENLVFACKHEAFVGEDNVFVKLFQNVDFFFCLIEIFLRLFFR